MSMLTNRWFIGGAGMGAFALFIWFWGPYISIGDFTPLAGIVARLVTILVVLAIWGGVQFFRDYREKKSAEELSAGIVEAEAEDDTGARSAEEIEALRTQFEEAMEVMRKSGQTKGGKEYELPWYMIIGPPGAGKTTALINSGLRFPLSDRFGKTALRGVGGTRNCDWWFTEEAILLDTAGRYTTQDSQAAVDKAAWEGFLSLLQKHRKRRPINGVLVAVSATDFMTYDAAQRREHANAIKERIRELDDFFGMRFPVYVLVTKCDLINGFIDFFDDLSADEREQVWGVTLPIADEQPAEVSEQLDRELGALFGRLDERLLARIHAERDVKHRGQIYSFPQQMHALKGVIVEFIDDVFRGSRFEEAALLRGVYFTSGTQEGTPIDRVMGSIARSFGLEQQALPSFAGQGRSYFITRLLQQVVFREAGVAGTNQKVEQRRAWLQRFAYAGVFVLVGLLATAWTISYFGNQALIADVEAKAAAARAKLDEIPTSILEPTAALDALDATRDVVDDAQADGSLLTGWGLHQGGKLADRAQAAYRRALVGQLLPRVMLRLEQQIASANQSLDYVYEALKAYLRLGSDKRYDANEIGGWVTFDWEARLARELGQERFAALVGHLAALLSERAAELPLPMDRTLVADARARLVRVPLDERIYTRLRGSSVTRDIPGFTILDRAGPASLRVFVRDSGRSLNDGISGFFTRQGYKTVFMDTSSVDLVRELSAEQWVLRDDFELGGAQEISRLMGRLRDLYFEDYVREYKDLIYDIELAPFADARDAAGILDELSRPGDSPLTNLIVAISDETDFSRPLDGGADAVDSAAAQFSEQATKLSDRFGTPEAPTPTFAVGTTNIVEEEFAEFHKLTGGQDAAGGQTPLGHLLGLMRELADFMRLVASEETADGVPQDIVRSGQATLERVRMESNRMAVPVLRDLLMSAAVGADNIASGGVAKNIEAQWQTGPLAFCTRAIANRYPVSRAGQTHIRLEDFGRFFGFGGEADKFFEGYLKDKIDTTRKPWRAAAGRGVQISPNAIAQFERARAVRDAFFRGDTVPSAGFQLTPISMDATITQFSLTIDGQGTSYAHGPRVPQNFAWPGPRGVGEVRMEMAPGNGAPMRTEQGPWAWFKALDQARIRAGETPETFQVEFRIGDRSATYRLTAQSAYNPFLLPELSQFRCPGSLTQ